MGGEFFFMVLVAGVVATHCTLMMALWAGALGLPRADFPAGIAAITFGDSFHGAAPYWSGLFVIHLNGAFFAFLSPVVGWFGVAITGTEHVGFTLILTEGFGTIPMAQKTFKLLSAHAGEKASISGATQRITTATIISTTNGTTPQTTSPRGMSGAMFLMTKMFSPTGG